MGFHRKAGTSIFDESLKAMGYTKVCYGSFTLSTAGGTVTLNHNFGISPKLVYIRRKGFTTTAVVESYFWNEMVKSNQQFYSFSSVSTKYQGNVPTYTCTYNTTTFKPNLGSACYFGADCEYEYIILA